MSALSPESRRQLNVAAVSHIDDLLHYLEQHDIADEQLLQQMLLKRLHSAYPSDQYYTDTDPDSTLRCPCGTTCRSSRGRYDSLSRTWWCCRCWVALLAHIGEYVWGQRLDGREIYAAEPRMDNPGPDVDEEKADGIQKQAPAPSRPPIPRRPFRRESPMYESQFARQFRSTLRDSRSDHAMDDAESCGTDSSTSNRNRTRRHSCSRTNSGATESASIAMLRR